MSDDHRTVAAQERQALLLKAQPTTLRRCLACDGLMHSTGPDHRLCNTCKGEYRQRGSLVGERVRERRR